MTTTTSTRTRTRTTRSGRWEVAEARGSRARHSSACCSSWGSGPCTEHPVSSRTAWVCRREWLSRLPVDTWTWPGVALLVTVAVPHLVAAWLVWRHDTWAGVAGVVVGAALVLWIVVQLVDAPEVHLTSSRSSPASASSKRPSVSPGSAAAAPRADAPQRRASSAFTIDNAETGRRRHRNVVRVRVVARQKSGSLVGTTSVWNQRRRRSLGERLLRLQQVQHHGQRIGAAVPPHSGGERPVCSALPATLGGWSSSSAPPRRSPATSESGRRRPGPLDAMGSA